MSIKGSLFYIFLIAIISIVFINTKSYLVLLGLIPLLIILFKKYGFVLVFLSVAVFAFFSFYRVNKIEKIENDYYENEILKVDDAKEKYIIVSKDEVKYLIYTTKFELEFEENEEIRVSGDVHLIEDDLEMDVFEFKEYLNHKRVFYQIDCNKIESIKKNTKLSKKIKDFLTSKLTDESYLMTSMLLFNNKDVDENLYNNLKNINAIHLFVVSGFHISFLFRLIMFLFKKIKLDDAGKIVGVIVCLIYVFILDFSIGATRALISLFVATFLNKYLNRLDGVAIAGFVVLLIEPISIYSYSFIMSFAMASVLSFTNSLLSKQNKIVQAIAVSFISFLTMIPIQLIINYKINPICLLSNIFLNYVVIVIFILCIIGMPLSLANGNVFGRVYSLFNDIVSRLSSFNTSIVLGSVKPWMICIYYVALVALFVLIENKKYKASIANAFVILLMFVALYNRQYFIFNPQVTFLNVYQGDCSIIVDSKNGGVMLIDTGGLQNYDIASKKIIPYLEYQGIRKIDKIVITHHDYDHYGALESLKTLIKIEKIIEDCNVASVSIGKISFTNLNIYTDLATNENDCSIVLYGNIGGYNYLFTGDASNKIEKLIINDNKELDVDILKVGHHGSDTSTCEQFVSVIKPSVAIISVGKNNKYGHPTKIVLDILTKYDCDIYRTDIDGTIRITNTKNEYRIETAK